MHEYVILVDEQDNVLDTAEKMLAHQQGLLHRAFSVFVVQQRDNGWYTLLQQRSLNKYHCAGLWTNTCCSHPRLEESIEQAGQRRLKEEMGVTLTCHKVGEFTYQAELENGLIEHEYDHILISAVSDDLFIDINPNEVMAFRWLSFETLVKMPPEQQTMFTPWFFQAFDIVKQHLIE